MKLNHRMFVFLLAISLLAALAGPARGDSVEMIDARRLEGKVLEVSADTIVFRTDGEDRELPRREVSAVRFEGEADDLMAVRERAVVTTAAGDVVGGKDLQADEQKLTLRTDLLGAVELELSALRAVYLPRPDLSPRSIQQQARELDLAQTDRDTLIVSRSAGDWLAVSGTLRGIRSGRILFQWQGQNREIATSSVPCIRLAAVGGEQEVPAGWVVARDGTVLAFSALSLTGDRLVIQHAQLGGQEIPRDQVAEVRFSATDSALLSELEPASVTERGFFETTWPHRVDRAVSGQPLRLDGRTFARGLGLHSYSELTWNLDGQYEMLVTMAGIDDAVRPHGDATLTFLGDGETLAEPVRLTGEDSARPVRLDVSGVQTLTIRVDFGEDALGVGDHVNLAGARLLE